MIFFQFMIKDIISLEDRFHKLHQTLKFSTLIPNFDGSFGFFDLRIRNRKSFGQLVQKIEKNKFGTPNNNSFLILENRLQCEYVFKHNCIINLYNQSVSTQIKI